MDSSHEITKIKAWDTRKNHELKLTQKPNPQRPCCKRCWIFEPIDIGNKTYRFRLDTNNDVTKDPILDLELYINDKKQKLEEEMHHTKKQTKEERLYLYKDKNIKLEIKTLITHALHKKGNAFIKIAN